MQVAILAGGLGTRLRPVTEDIPKCLVRILDKPFLAYQLELLKRNGVTRIVLCTGYLGEQIEDHFGDGARFGVHIEYSREGERLLGTAGALKKAEPLLDQEFFTLYGDSYLFVDFSVVTSYFRKQTKLALMTVYKNFDRYDRSNTAIEGNLVTKFSKKEKTEDMVYIEYGANVFKKEVLKMVPEDQPYSLDDLFPRLIEQGELLAFEIKERFYEIGSALGLRELEEFVKSKQIK